MSLNPARGTKSSRAVNYRRSRVARLLALWVIEHPTTEIQNEVAAIIKSGDADIAAGRGRPADEVNEALQHDWRPNPDAEMSDGYSPVGEAGDTTPSSNPTGPS